MSTKKSTVKKAVIKKASGQAAAAPLMMAAFQAPDGSMITMQGILAIDTDGIGDPHKDPDHQNETSAKLDKNGKFVPKSDPTGVRFLNADKDEYSVAPKNLAVVNGGHLKLGDLTTVILPNGTTHTAPIGDFGPAHQAGEFSLAAVQNSGVQILFTKKGPIPTLDGPNASDIHVTVTFIPNSAP